MTRRILVAALALLPAMDAAAEVHLSRSRDGSAIIYNVGGSRPSSRSAIDYEWLARQRDRVSPYDEVIERYSHEYGVDARLVKAIITVESNFNPGVVSSKGARGLMQLMPATARRFGVTDVHDPTQNIRGGIAFLAELKRLFGSDLNRVLAGYNAGENAVIRYRGIPPYSETRLYVAKALTVYHGRPMGAGNPVTASDFGGNRLGGGFKSARPGVVVVPASPTTLVSDRRGRTTVTRQ